MVKLIRYIFTKIKEILGFGLDSLIYILPIYYKSFDTIKLRKWFQVQNGNLKALYKVHLFNRVPVFFLKIVMDMIYSMPVLDLTLLRKKADVAILNSIAQRTGNKSMKFQADIMIKEIQDKESKLDTGKEMNLDEFIDYIELTFESIGMIDADKMTASRAFSLFHKAVEKNKRLEKLYNKE